MRLTARFLILLVVLAGVPFAIAFPGCSGQGEGERCDTRADNAGDEDCAGDLHCYQAGTLNGSNTDRCCPWDRTKATTVVCQLQVASGIDAAAPPPPDAGGDAPADAPIDVLVPTDAGPDAPADAPEGG